ncbi:SCO family protein [Natrialbaceae archaeon A-CW3]
MNRRALLRSGALAAAVGTAGCLGSLLEDEGAEHAVLDPQDDQIADSADLAYPAYGEAFPDFSLPDPFTEELVETAEIDSCLLVTAFYTFCPAECIPLMNTFAGVQGELLEAGREADATILAISFDPERDTVPALEEHADMMGIEYTADNWHYLRPEDDDRATEVVDEKLGIAFEQADGYAGYDYTHAVLSFLVNPDGYVERAYRGENLPVDGILDDLETVVAAFE